jgi:hypothetical protein
VRERQRKKGIEKGVKEIKIGEDVMEIDRWRRRERESQWQEERERGLCERGRDKKSSKRGEIGET